VSAAVDTKKEKVFLRSVKWGKRGSFFVTRSVGEKRGPTAYAVDDAAGWGPSSICIRRAKRG